MRNSYASRAHACYRRHWLTAITGCDLEHPDLIFEQSRSTREYLCCRCTSAPTARQRTPTTREGPSYVSSRPLREKSKFPQRSNGGIHEKVCIDWRTIVRIVVAHPCGARPIHRSTRHTS